MTLHADVTGDGPPLVLVHGFTGGAAAWHDLVPALAARHTTIAVELPGHGRSPAPPAGTALPAVADALVATLDGLGIPRADWLGYSLGGRAVLHVALGHPTRVDRLVLESTSPGIEDAAARAARAETDGALAAGLEHDGIEAFVDHWMAQPLFATQTRLAPEVRARARAVRLAHSATGLAAALRAMGVGGQASLWPRLRDLAAPVLLVVGEEDARYREQAAAMAARLPRARLAVVPAAGHAVHLENPAAWLAVVEGFFDERWCAASHP